MDESTNVAQILLNRDLDSLCPFVPVSLIAVGRDLGISVWCEGKKVPHSSAEDFDTFHGSGRRITFTPTTEGEVVVEVKSGGAHAVRSPLVLRCNAAHAVWGWGEGMFTSAGSPQKIETFPLLSAGHTVVDVSTSSQHCLVLTSTGAIFSMGSLNQLGELGLGHNDPAPVLQRVPLNSQVVSVTARDGGSMVVDHQGQVYCAGLCTALTGGVRSYSNQFVTPPGLDNIRVVVGSAMFVGEKALCLQAITGRVYEFGSFGRTGMPFRARVCASFQKAVPVRVLRANLSHRFAINMGGQMFYAMGEAVLEALDVQQDYRALGGGAGPAVAFSHVTDIKLTKGSACFLTEQGKVFERVIEPKFRFSDWRPSSSLAIKPYFLWREVIFKTAGHPIVEMSSGSNHFLFLSSVGEVFGFGNTEASQLGCMGGIENEAIAIAKCPRGNRIKSTGQSSYLVVGVAQSLLGESMWNVWKEEQRFFDCEVISGEHSFPCHGVVLAARLPSTFHDTKLICQSQVSKEVLLLFLEFIYTDRLSALPYEAKEPLHRLGEEFHLERLKVLTAQEVDVSALFESTLSTDFASMVGDERFSDFSITVVDGSEQRRIACHRCMLQRSDYFASLMHSGMNEAKSGDLTMQTNINGIAKSLSYIYGESCDDFTGDDCIDVLIASNRLLLPRLKELMELEVLKGVDETNVGFVYECGVMAQSDRIMNACLDFAHHNVDRVRSAGGLDALTAESKKVFFGE